MSHTRALAALADPTRRRTFELLCGGAMAVGEIAEQMPVTRPAVSQHLRVLKEAGLVTERREGTRRLYSMDAEGVQAVRAYFDRMWTDALGSYERFAQQLTEPDRPKERKDTT